MKMINNKVNEKLKDFKGWKFDGNIINKTFEFKDFVKSIDFVNKIMPIAEEMQHHPDITINYNNVIITLSTHDEGGVTEKDFKLAEKIDNLIK